MKESNNDNNNFYFILSEILKSFILSFEFNCNTKLSNEKSSKILCFSEERKKEIIMKDVVI